MERKEKKGIPVSTHWKREMSEEEKIESWEA
jgi:hypothetical protein